MSPNQKNSRRSSKLSESKKQPRRNGGRKNSEPSEQPRGMGLDLSLTATGVVVWDGRRVLRGGVLATEPMPKAVKGREPGVRVKRDGSRVYRGVDQDDRIEWIARRVASSIRKFKPGIICIEGHSFGSKRAGQGDVLHELGGVIKNRLRREGYWQGSTYFLIAPTSLKKIATGNGRADKIEMIEMAQDSWPGCPDEDNVADAFHLAVEAQERYAKILAEGF